jgi:Flp pilus assembly protein CpaB
MNRNRLLMIGFIALALGAFVSFVVYRNLQSSRGGKQAPGEDIIVAANDLQVGSKIEEKDIKFVHFPSADLPAGVFHLPNKVIGRGASGKKIPAFASNVETDDLWRRVNYR